MQNISYLKKKIHNIYIYNYIYIYNISYEQKKKFLYLPPTYNALKFFLDDYFGYSFSMQ